MTAKSSTDHGKQIPATAPDPPCHLGCCPAGPALAGLWAWRRGCGALCARGARALLPRRGQHPTTPVSSSPGRRGLWWTPINQSGGPEARRVHQGEVTHLLQGCPPRLRCLLRARSLWLCPRRCCCHKIPPAQAGGATALPAPWFSEHHSRHGGFFFFFLAALRGLGSQFPNSQHRAV